MYSPQFLELEKSSQELPMFFQYIEQMTDHSPDDEGVIRDHQGIRKQMMESCLGSSKRSQISFRL